MRMYRLMIVGCLLLVGLAIDAAAQGEAAKAKAKDKGKMQAAPTTILTDPLEPADLVAKLKLAPAQKSAVDKLFKEYDGKLKDLVTKAPAGTAAPAPSKFAKFKGKGGAVATASPAIAAAIELRGEYEDKFEELLTDPQKKVLEEARLKMGEALLLGGKK